MRKWTRFAVAAVAIAAATAPVTAGVAQAETTAPAACVRMATNQSLVPKYVQVDRFIVMDGYFGGEFTTCRSIGTDPNRLVDVSGTQYWIFRKDVHRI